MLQKFFELTGYIIYNNTQNINDPEKRFRYLAKRFANINILIDPELIYVSDEEINNIYQMLYRYYGFDKEYNTTTMFDLDAMLNKPECELAVHQLLNYLTVYWFRGDVLDKESVYIQSKQLKSKYFDTIEADKQTFHQMKLIRFDLAYYLLLNEYIKNNRAFSTEQLETMMKLYREFVNKYDFPRVSKDEIKNKQLRLLFMVNYLVKEDKLDPDDLLRFIIFRVTGKLDIVNSKRFKKLLKESMFKGIFEPDELLNLFHPYIQNPEPFIKHFKQQRNYRLWKIIHRKIQEMDIPDLVIIDDLFKKARYDKKIKSERAEIINKLLKGEVKDINPSLFVSIYTELFFTALYTGASLNPLVDYLRQVIDKVPFRYVIRLYNKLITDYNHTPNPRLYINRLGERFARFNYYHIQPEYYKFIEASLLVIQNHLRDKYGQGKKYNIDDTIAGVKIPVSDKQFVQGFYPYGSVIKLPQLGDYFLVGIHWKNIINEREEEIKTDLDLSAKQIKFEKYRPEKAVYDGSKTLDISWFSHYKNDDDLNGFAEAYFSGDMTYASHPDGATEFIMFNKESIKNQKDDLVLSLNVNYFHPRTYPIEFQLFIIPITKKFFNKLKSIKERNNDILKLSKIGAVNIKNAIFSLPITLQPGESLYIGLIDVKKNKLYCGRKIVNEQVAIPVYSRKWRKDIDLPVHIAEHLLHSEDNMSIKDLLSITGRLSNDGEELNLSNLNIQTFVSEFFNGQQNQ